MPWRARRSKIWRIMGVSTTGAMGLGISPVSGKSLVPLPAARTIALTEGRPSRTAKSLPVLYILLDAQGDFKSILPPGQVRRALESFLGLEDGGPRRRSSGACGRG